MAFSATVKASAYLGPGLKMTVGDWSGVAGDAAGTLKVSGRYWGGLFFDADVQGNTSQIFPNVGESVAGSVTTLTIQNQDNVTSGRFVILHSA